MKCKNCEIGILVECPTCGCEVVLCCEDGCIEILPGDSWDNDYECNGVGDGKEYDSD